MRLRFYPAALCVFTLLATAAAQETGYEIHLAAARSAEHDGNLPKAETEYEACVAVHQEAEAFERLGLVRHLLNKFEPAITAFKSAVAMDPSRWASQLFLGVDLYRTNRFSDALTPLVAASRLQPANSEVLFWIGVTQIALKDHLSGIRALEALRRKEPHNTEVLRVLAETYAEVGSSILSQVAEQQPGSIAGLRVHAQALEFEGNNQGALAAYHEAIDLDPRAEGLHAALGRVHESLGHADTAQSAFREELILDPVNSDANFAIGSAFAGQQHFENALPYLQKAAEWSTYREEPWTALAQTCLSLGQVSAAREAANHALSLAPTSVIAKALLARVPP